MTWTANGGSAKQITDATTLYIYTEVTGSGKRFWDDPTWCVRVAALEVLKHAEAVGNAGLARRASNLLHVMGQNDIIFLDAELGILAPRWVKRLPKPNELERLAAVKSSSNGGTS